MIVRRPIRRGLYGLGAARCCVDTLDAQYGGCDPNCIGGPQPQVSTQDVIGLPLTGALAPGQSWQGILSALSEPGSVSGGGVTSWLNANAKTVGIAAAVILGLAVLRR